MSSEGGRPPVSSREFRRYFEEVVRSSKGQREAATRLGYRDTKTVWHHMKRLGIPSPPRWSRRPHLAVVARRNIPEVVIHDAIGRRWVAGLVQGEGCIQCTFRQKSDCTYLNLDLSMADRAPIDRLSDYYGLSGPGKAAKNHQWKRLWRKNISGLRALRVLQEILPYLLGEKRREAERALEVFGPNGCRRGFVSTEDVWPRNEFQLRTKRRSRKSPGGK